MALDNTMIEIFTTVKKEVEEKFGIVLSVEEIHSVWHTQVEAFKYAIIKGLTINFFRFGKFVDVKRKETAKESTKFISSLSVFKELHPELDEVTLRKQYAIIKAKQKAEFLKSKTRVQGMSVNEVLDTPNKGTYNPLFFKVINKKIIKSNE